MLQRTPEERDRAKHRINALILILDFLLVIYLVLLVLRHWIPDLVQWIPFIDLLVRAA